MTRYKAFESVDEAEAAAGTLREFGFDAEVKIVVGFDGDADAEPIDTDSRTDTRDDDDEDDGKDPVPERGTKQYRMAKWMYHSRGANWTTAWEAYQVMSGLFDAPDHVSAALSKLADRGAAERTRAKYITADDEDPSRTAYRLTAAHRHEYGSEYA